MTTWIMDLDIVDSIISAIIKPCKHCGAHPVSLISYRDPCAGGPMEIYWACPTCSKSEKLATVVNLGDTLSFEFHDYKMIDTEVTFFDEIKDDASLP